MGRVGRPEVLDERKRAEVCAVLAVGASQRMAARYVGVSDATIRRTAQRDPEFAHDLARAVARNELFQLHALDRAARTDRYWRAAAWKLERADPEQYRLNKQEGVTPEQLSQVLEELGDVLCGLAPRKAGARQLKDRVGEIARKLRGARRFGS